MDKRRERSRHRSKDDREEDDSNAKALDRAEVGKLEEKERLKRNDDLKERGDRDGLPKEEASREKLRHREHDRHRDSKRPEKQRELESDGPYRDKELREDYREKEKERDRDNNLDDYREKERDRDNYRDDYLERERERDRYRDGKEKDKRERYRDDREKEIRDREKEELREREKLKEKERRRREPERREREWREIDERDRRRRRREEESGRPGEKLKRYRERESEREVEKNREKNRDEDHDREHERKRRKKEEEAGKPDGVPQKDVEEVDFLEEQRRLDEEMEKRRRRVQEWQELRRRKEEEERKKRVEAGESVDQPENAGKSWTLEGESDDEDVPLKTDDLVKFKGNMNPVLKASGVENGDFVMYTDTDEVGVNDFEKDRREKQNDGDAGEIMEDEELDPLDAFMNATILPEVEKLNSEVALKVETDKQSKSKFTEVTSNGGKQANKMTKITTGRFIPGENSGSEEEGDYADADAAEEDDDDFVKRVKKSKAEKLAIVDHSKIDYAPFRKNFYIEVKEISKMSPEDVSEYRKQLELKTRGKNAPKPIKTWNQTGLSSKVLDGIKKLGFEKPMPIQTQALPIIMSGRDCIGIAKTGSGKTLAFVLPMLRHVMDQPPLSPGDGPIGLIMAPTRELVQQIYNDIRKFTKGLGLSCVPVYGGSGVAQQISDLKRGTEIVVCTPGRMIDILVTSAGKITNLRRVTYLVLDEADRMFDMGFEPQITRIIQNTRPDRQTVLFSATFPRQVEVLARKILNKPVEIQVGGRSVVNKDIAQTIEVRVESERFLRLLELLGEWYEKGKILIFVHSQEKCDSLFKDLLKRGYPCLSLHGGKDQTDRESTLSDFKSDVCNLLIATSVAARGLDVKDLELVVNYDVPNHYEEYVHRVGRTGRAGRKGMAITFISEEEARYAPDLVKALELSEQPIPDDLKKLADDFTAKVNQGTEQVHASGYGGSGFKFNEEEDEARRAAKKAQAREFGFEEDEDKSDSESDSEGIRKAGGDLAQVAAAAAMAVAQKAGLSGSLAGTSPLSIGQPVSGSSSAKGMTPTLPGLGLGGMQLALPGMAGLANMVSSSTGISTIPGLGVPGFGLASGVTPGIPNEGAARAAALAAALNLQHNLAKIQADAMPEHYEAELEINDFPQHARWKVTHKDSLGPISEWTGAAITTRGQYFPPGKIPAPGERRLYLFIEGPTEASVKKAKTEIKRILEESTAAAISLPSGAQAGKYSVM